MQTVDYLESDYSRSYAIWLISIADLKSSAPPKKNWVKASQLWYYRAYVIQVLFRL